MRKAQSDSLKIDSYAAEAGLRQCDAPGCREPGEHRAPKSRDRLEDYYWFCLDHVRSYNKQWNYYEGVSPEELEQAIRRSTTWDRPTWPLGAAAAYRKFVAGDYRDPFGALNGDEEMGAASGAGPARPGAETAEGKAFAIMGLEPPVSEVELKARYKQLVKKHHPDANGGDKQAEERLKIINEAYTTLKKFLS
ncbi:MAG: DnaJ domain-containing protein [Nisaea sp.]|jgi:DnaJ-domain-containing protein 1|uniref:J domain-containing protein n=1 Tax=Nisaea sp. TaxID=2024842 RepID=UPI001B1D8AAE|nr:DnaJ domain-containing protein [Nisaea sp.]MBO6560858.1 DnaJ domain-containing protein [Nisaea sp.]